MSEPEKKQETAQKQQQQQKKVKPPRDEAELAKRRAEGEAKKAAAKAAAEAKKAQMKAEKAAAAAAAKKKDTGDLLGIEAKKATQFPEWYQQVITRSDMLDYYDVSGCYILRPWAYRQWELVQSYLDDLIKKSGVLNAYFPIFVSQQALKKEEDAFNGFNAEVAWVTKSGKSDLSEPIAVRPTSETVMYSAFKNWVRSHRDLPLRVNQWCNVVRWEFKHPVPFIRTREFLWQEGHSVYATYEESEREVMEILGYYASVYEDLLAVPVMRGRKTEKEKFAGALFTTTVEAFIPTNGRAVQAATSHCLGQSFAKIFDITVENDKHEKQYVWQNSWGLTTRSLGVCTMVHGDDKGLVLPPRVAPVQVVFIPLRYKETVEAVQHRAEQLFGALKDSGIRCLLDDSDNTGGWKYNHWEVRGVPLRIELGPRDLEKEVVVFVRRDTGAKETVTWTNMISRAKEVLEDMQKSLFAHAKEERDKHIVRCTSWDEFMQSLIKRNMCLCPWCNKTSCEEDIKVRSQNDSITLAKTNADAAAELAEEQATSLTGAAKSLCIPFEQPELPEATKCFACGEPAKCWCLFGRSY